MNAIASQVPPSLMAELTMHLSKSGSQLSPAQAAALAIRAWIASQEHPAPKASNGESGRGYQWKSLFLPEGTELRMSTAGATCHARVVGDDIIFNGSKVSPRGMTLAIAGEGRNAWRDLWLRFPGDRHFLPATRCRRERAQAATATATAIAIANSDANTAAMPVASPADSLNAAALTLAEALKATLALMERASARPLPVENRRGMTPRRDIDILADHCAFD